MSGHDKIRNLAIVAHIDHGKTTLIDSIFRAAHVFRDNQHMAERVMDSNALERERGITIRSKHCAVKWGDYRINIIDTPGHADFSGEVERVLSMVDSVLLLVDANEGPMPQTRYVTMRALRRGLKPIVVVNKVDRPNARPHEALEKTFELFLELGATDEQADFPVLYGSGLDGWMSHEGDGVKTEGLTALFEAIVKHVPPPAVEEGAPFRMQVSTLAWNDYVGRIGGGRVLSGSLKLNQPIRRTVSRWLSPGDAEAGWETGESNLARATRLWTTEGLEKVEAEEIVAGDIVWLAGSEEITIGDTFSAPEMEDPALPPLEIEEPTVSMFFLVNSSPFAGRDGKAVTLRQIKDRLDRELRVNVALRVEDLGRPDGVKVSGRGELHLAILIEEMRREGFEICVSRPEVITRIDDGGKVLEPMEQLFVDTPEDFQGAVIEKLARRKGEMTHMHVLGNGGVRLEFSIPTRGLIGYRNDFLTDTRGLGIMAARFVGYGPWRGEIQSRTRGSLVSMDTGPATGFSLENLQQRASLFVEPGTEVYEGQVVGENSRNEDMPCNPTKKKALTNHRASGKDHTVTLDVARKMSLDQALEWIAPDELVETTPNSVRIRKAILNAEQRKMAHKRSGAGVG